MGTVKNKKAEIKETGIEEKILDAALEVVSTKTISGTRMHLIAEVAGIPKSNLHYYFKTKQNLMLALHRKALNRFIEVRRANRPIGKDSLRDDLAVFFKQKLDLILNEPEYDFVEIDFWLQSNIEPEYKRIMRDGFNNWRQEIEDIMVKHVPDLPMQKKKLLPYTLISLLEGATLQYHLDSKNFDVESYMDFCMDLILKQLNEE